MIGVDPYVASLVASIGSTVESLDEFCVLAGGVSPTDVLAVVTTMEQERPDSVPKAMRRLKQSSLRDEVTSRLPLPHPLDFDWRFSRTGSEWLVRQGLKRTLVESPNVALLGTPSFAEFCCEGAFDRRPTLFEVRPEPCAALDGLPLDIVLGDVTVTGQDLAGRFDLIIADPPWYPGASSDFISAASGMLSVAGAAILVTPGLTTRPGIPSERRALVTFAQQLGLVLEGLIVCSVEYESPPFERAAFSAAGLGSFNPYWRRGDVLVFRKFAEVPPIASTSRWPASGPADEWTEIVHGPHRVRVRTSGKPSVGAALRSIVDGDVLPSVSRRDERRPLADVWTTTNRIYGTGDPSRLIAALRANASPDPGPAHEDIDHDYLRAATRILENEREGLLAISQT